MSSGRDRKSVYAVRISLSTTFRHKSQGSGWIQAALCQKPKHALSSERLWLL